MPRSALPIILFALTMWVIALMARLHDRSWITPASLFALSWAAYCPTLLFFVPDGSPCFSRDEAYAWSTQSVLRALAAAASRILRLDCGIIAARACFCR